MENRTPDYRVDEQSPRPAPKETARSRARAAADKVGIGKSQSLFTLVVVAILASILIAAYVLTLGYFIMHKKHTDTGSEAATQAARDLSDITVEHPSTGPLSLCKWRDRGTSFFDSATEKARSIESIKRTYKKIEEISTLTGVNSFKTLVRKDDLTLRQLEAELRSRLDSAIAAPQTSPPLQAGKTQYEHPAAVVTASRTYKSVAAIISNRYGMSDPSKLHLSITLGYSENVPPNEKLQIFPMPLEAFKKAPSGVAPNMVLVSFTEPASRENSNGAEGKQTQACVGIKPFAETPAPAAFVLTFPQGVPLFAGSLLDYLNYRQWNTRGIWNQATDGEMLEAAGWHHQ